MLLQGEARHGVDTPPREGWRGHEVPLKALPRKDEREAETSPQGNPSEGERDRYLQGREAQKVGALAIWDPGGGRLGKESSNRKGLLRPTRMTRRCNKTKPTSPHQNQSESDTINEEIVTHLGPYPCHPIPPLRSRFVFVLRHIQMARH